MSEIDIGIGSGDFIGNLLADLGTSISHVPVTEVLDFRGNKTVVFSGTSTKTVVFYDKRDAYSRDKTGTLMQLPAIMLHLTDSGIKRGDKIIFGTGTGSEWKVEGVDKRRGIYAYSELYLWV